VKNISFFNNYHPIRGVVWDMGGVILRTEFDQPRHELARRLGYSRAGLEAVVFNSETARLATVGKMTQTEHWTHTMKTLGLQPEQREEFEQAFWGGDRVDMDLIAYIRDLRPKYRVGLLSNAWGGMRQTLEAQYGIMDVFDSVTISAEVGCMKPEPEIYDICLHQLGATAGQTVFIDDMAENVTAARAAGWHAIQFKGREDLLIGLSALLDQMG
jgi:glucose-1-phosphatase